VHERSLFARARTVETKLLNKHCLHTQTQILPHDHEDGTAAGAGASVLAGTGAATVTGAAAGAAGVAEAAADEEAEADEDEGATAAHVLVSMRVPLRILPQPIRRLQHE
jgi:hypothetical protein